MWGGREEVIFPFLLTKGWLLTGWSNNGIPSTHRTIPWGGGGSFGPPAKPGIVSRDFLGSLQRTQKAEEPLTKSEIFVIFDRETCINLTFQAAVTSSFQNSASSATYY